MRSKRNAAGAIVIIPCSKSSVKSKSSRQPFTTGPNVLSIPSAHGTLDVFMTLEDVVCLEIYVCVERIDVVNDLG
jgi:hypothetical protein